MSLNRRTIWHPAWDHRKDGRGQHGVELIFLVTGPKGAVQFLLYTNWMRIDNGAANGRLLPIFQSNAMNPMPADRGYHSLVPMYEGQPWREDCPYLGGKPCYYDGSGLNSEALFVTLVNDGDDAMWTALEEYYHSTFDQVEASACP